MSAKHYLILSQVVAELFLFGCGSVTAAPPSPDAAADVGRSGEDAGGGDVVALGDVAEARTADASPDVGRPIIGCDQVGMTGVTVAQCPNDCRVAICTTSAAQLVGCPWGYTPEGRPAQFHCEPIGTPSMYLRPACVATCP